MRRRRRFACKLWWWWWWWSESSRVPKCEWNLDQKLCCSGNQLFLFH
jgi:hypothetical protein